MSLNDLFVHFDLDIIVYVNGRRYDSQISVPTKLLRKEYGFWHVSIEDNRICLIVSN